MAATVPTGTTLLRVAMPDRPGSLATLAGRLARAGLDIVRVEVVSADGTTAVDDLLVRGAGAERAVARLSDVRVLAVREDGTLPDPGLAMAAACARITAAETASGARMALVEAALALADAHRGALLRDRGDGRLEVVASTEGAVPPVALDGFGPARRALAEDAAVTASGDREWAPPPFRERFHGGAVAVVPAGVAHVLCVVRTDWFPFIETEVERLRGLARVAWGVLRRDEGAGTPAAAGGRA
jgi:ACT domain